MTATYRIHPSIGIARVGNSDGEFYIEPARTGGLPAECDSNGNETIRSGAPVPVTKFKDKDGKVRRQGSKFRIFKVEGDKEKEITLGSPDVEAITWEVHIANKKAAWYGFSELQGNTLYSTPTFDNSYSGQHIDLRNKKQTTGRQKLIIDPGPRSISGKNQKVEIGSGNIPGDYPFGSFPGKTKYGFDITKLGDLLTDDSGRLLVLGGMGNAGGDEPITSFAGADSWHDDVSDGYVACTVKLKGGEEITLHAWVIVGSPKFAPEIDNICTLSDVMLDVAIRYQHSNPDIFDVAKWPATGGWNKDYVINFQRDVAPIFERPKRYQWVSNVQCMMSFASLNINFKDHSAGNKKYRQKYFSFFRRPDPHSGDHMTLYKDNIPMQPMNSGSNSVSNELIDKFLTLTPTQYFFLEQWAEGKFQIKPLNGYPGISEKDQSSVGNCVGLPMCPGIEVTWNTQNPAIYSAPYQIKTRHEDQYYMKNGLSPDADETDGNGCEPGDLTKRMAIPWQADFFECTVQFINFTDPKLNADKNGPIPPAYYAYWWPPQSPWDVISGVLTAQEQDAAGIPAGLQVNFARGVNDFSQMIQAWSYLGFIVNNDLGEDRDLFPYFTETERNHDKFTATSIPVSKVSNNASDVLEVPVYFLKDEHMEMIALSAEVEAFTPLVTRRSNDLPRSGTRIRF